MFLKQNHAGLEEVIHIGLAPECHDIGPRPLAFLTIESFNIV